MTLPGLELDQPTPPGGLEPYYADEFATLYLADALDVLPTLPRNSADLLIADPPYGVGWYSHGRRAVPFGRIAGDHSTDLARELLKLAVTGGLLRNRRHLYLFGPAEVLDGLPLGGVTPLIWDKQLTGPGNLSLPRGPSHEQLTFAVLTRSASDRAAGDGRLAARLRRGSVLRHPRPNGRAVTRHPTEKPVPLLTELIESSSVRGDLVLDPCAGAGSTGVAAVLAGRRALLIELAEPYAATAAARLAEAARLRRQLDRL